MYEQSLLNLAFVSIHLYSVAWALASGVIHALTKIRFAHPSCYAGPEQTHQVSAFPVLLSPSSILRPLPLSHTAST